MNPTSRLDAVRVIPGSTASTQEAGSILDALTQHMIAHGGCLPCVSCTSRALRRLRATVLVPNPPKPMAQSSICNWMIIHETSPVVVRNKA